MRYTIAVNIGPVNSKDADIFLNKMRAYTGSLNVGSFMVGTENACFTLNSDSNAGAMMLAREFLMAVFGSATPLVRAISIRAIMI